MPKVSEIWAELGFKFERTTLGDFISSVKELDLSVVASAIGVGGLYKLMSEITGDAVNAATHLRLFNLATGIPEENIQRWERLAEKVGLTKETIDSVMQTLKNQRGPNFDVEEHFRNLNKATLGMGNAQAEAFLRSHGVADIHAVLALKDMNEEWQKMPVVMDKGNKSLADLGETARGFGNDVKNSFNQFASMYAPNLITSIGMMEKAFDNAKPTVGAFFEEIVIWATAAGLSIMDFADSIPELKKKADSFLSHTQHEQAGMLGLGSSVASAVTNISVVVHGAHGGPAEIGAAVAAELKNILLGAEHQSPRSRI